MIGNGIPKSQSNAPRPKPMFLSCVIRPFIRSLPYKRRGAQKVPQKFVKVLRDMRGAMSEAGKSRCGTLASADDAGDHAFLRVGGNVSQISSLMPQRRGISCQACPLRLRPAFQPKPDDEIAFLTKLKTDQRHISAGADIIHAGQQEAELFTLFSGWAFRYKTLEDGRRQILNFLLPGDLMGLQAALLAAAEHSIEALTDVEVCVFSRSKIWTIFEQRPQLAYDISWLGAREEGFLDENLTTVGQRSARERIASLVLGLYRRAEHLGLVADQSFAFPLSRQHIADALGLSLVHTIKTWSSLRRAGLFELKGGILKVLNPRLTEALAKYYDSEWRQRPLI